ATRKVAKCGYLFVAPGWDFSNPVNRTKLSFGQSLRVPIKLGNSMKFPGNICIHMWKRKATREPEKRNRSARFERPEKFAVRNGRCRSRIPRIEHCTVIYTFRWKRSADSVPALVQDLEKRGSDCLYLSFSDRLHTILLHQQGDALTLRPVALGNMRGRQASTKLRQGDRGIPMPWPPDDRRSAAGSSPAAALSESWAQVWPNTFTRPSPCAGPDSGRLTVSWFRARPVTRRLY
ncbi:unnamed protein product, partial [Nesidiocoris tenuis]